MRTKTTERIVTSKIVRVVLSMALALSVCASAPASAFAAGSVNVTIGDDIPYAGHSTTHMYADGEVAYCAEPASSTPAPGTYSKSGVSDRPHRNDVVQLRRPGIRLVHVPRHLVRRQRLERG